MGAIALGTGADGSVVQPVVACSANSGRIERVYVGAKEMAGAKASRLGSENELRWKSPSPGHPIRHILLRGTNGLSKTRLIATGCGQGSAKRLMMGVRCHDC